MQTTGVRTRLDKGTMAARLRTMHRSKVAPLTIAASRVQRPVLRCEPKKSRSLQLQYARSRVDPPHQHVETVGEVMTTGRIYTVSADTPVLDALELIVEKKITGLPVVDEDNKVVGVVSDFDMLPIDLPHESQTNMFPSLDQSWELFHDLQTTIAKSEGVIVEDVMTEDPIVVRAETDIHAAARLLLETHTRRLPVVDAAGALIGVITRRDIVVAALASRRKSGEYFTNNGEVLIS